MKFDTVDPKELEFSFTTENRNVVFVKVYMDFNDEKTTALFPRSSANYIPGTTYMLPQSYFTEAFWNAEKNRIHKMLRVWITNRSKLETVPSDKREDPKFVAAMSAVSRVMKMCVSMLSSCWNGDRSKPPMPLNLYRDRMEELKDFTKTVVMALNDFSPEQQQLSQQPDDDDGVEIVEVVTNGSGRLTIEEGRRKRRSRTVASQQINEPPPAEQKPSVDNDDDSSVEFIEVVANGPKKSKHEERDGEMSSDQFVEEIIEILGMISAAHEAGVDVSGAKKRVDEARTSIREGRPNEEITGKLKSLRDEWRSWLQRTEKMEPQKEVDFDGEATLARSVPAANSDPAPNSDAEARPSGRGGRRKSSMKRKRAVRSRRDSSEKISTTPTTANNKPSDIVSRVKRGVRNRKPARSFTPGHTPPASPSPSRKSPSSARSSSSERKSRSSSRSSSYAKKSPSKQKSPVSEPTPKRTSYGDKRASPMKGQRSKSSPDSGRPSSNESGDNAHVQQREVSAPVEEEAVAPVHEMQSPENPPQADSSSGDFSCVSADSSAIPTTPIYVPAPPKYSSPIKPTPQYAPNVSINAEMQSPENPPQADSSSGDFSCAFADSSATPTTPIYVTATPRNTSPIKPIKPTPQYIPSVSINAEAALALQRELVLLGDAQLTLTNMMAAGPGHQYHFVPLIIQTIEKARAALENTDMIAYAIHKAAIDAGCNQLWNVMRVHNPLDPCSQLTSLATFMGLNPSAFRPLLPPIISPPGLSPNVLAGLQNAASVVAARESMAGGCPMSAMSTQQSADAIPGFIERDISQTLL